MKWLSLFFSLLVAFGANTYSGYALPWACVNRDGQFGDGVCNNSTFLIQIGVGIKGTNVPSN